MGHWSRLLRAVMLAAPMLLGARLSLAQTPVTPARHCTRPDTTAGWYRLQRDWWALDAGHDWTDDALRTALLSGASHLRHDANAVFPLQVGADVPGSDGEAPSAEILALRQRLREMAARRTWPVRSLVGPAGVHAAWLISRGDSALSGIAMHRMMESGPGEVSPADVAVLEDWMRLQNGRKQVYASQLRASRDARGRIHLEPAPTEDLAHVDLRRDAAGLPPLAFAVCSALRTTR